MAEAKRPRVDEELGPEDEGDGLDGLGEEGQNPERQALEDADQLQQTLEQINDEASDRVLAVEQEYNKKRRPIYTQRNTALSRIPGFWKKVLMIHPVIRNYVSEADLDVMEHLVEVDVEDFEDIKSGFRVKFVFADGNPYFTNRELTKELRFADDASLTVTGTDIQWLPGMEPAGDDDAAQPGDKRALASGIQYNLFSSWFDGQHTLEMGHDDLADVLKDDIWPDPLRWFKEAQEVGDQMFVGGEGDLEDEGEYEEEGEEGEGEDYPEAGDAAYVEGQEFVVQGYELAEGEEGLDEGEEEDEGAEEGDEGPDE